MVQMDGVDGDDDGGDDGNEGGDGEGGEGEFLDVCCCWAELFTVDFVCCNRT